MKKSILTKLSAVVAAFTLAAIAWVTCLNVPATASAGTNDIFRSTNEIFVSSNVEAASYLNIKDSPKMSMGALVTVREQGTEIVYNQNVILGEGENNLMEFFAHPTSEQKAAGAIANGFADSVDVFITKVKPDDTLDMTTRIQIRMSSDLYNPGDAGDWTEGGLVGLLAAASDQTLMGTDKGAEKLRDKGPVARFSFNQDRAINSDFPNGEFMGFIYDTTTKEVKTSAKVLTDYSNVIRDLDKNYPSYAGSSKLLNAGDKVQISMKFNMVKESYSLFFTKVGFESACEELLITNATKQIVGTGKSLPSAMYYGNDTPEDLKNVSGAQYRITDPDDHTSDWTAYSSSSCTTDLFDEEGEYTVHYRAPKPGTSPVEYFETNIVIPVVTQVEADKFPVVISPIVTDWSTVNTFPGQDANGEFGIEVGANMHGGLDISGYDTVTKTYSVYKDANDNGVYDAGTDTVAKDNDDLDLSDVSIANNKFSLKEGGTYFVIYKGVDGLGRTATSDAYKLTSSWAAHTFSYGGEEEMVGFGSDSVFLTPSKADINFYDIRISGLGNSVDYNVTIRITKPGAVAAETYDENFTFDKFGEYKVEYEVAYDYNSVQQVTTLYRTLKVVDVTPPVLYTDITVPMGTVVDGDKPETDGLIYLRAKKGTAITLPAVHAHDAIGESSDTIDENVQYFETKPGALSENKSTAYMANRSAYTLNLSSKGQYTLVFQAIDGGGLVASLTYIIDVRDEWLYLELEKTPELTQNSGTGVVIPNFKPLTLDGNVATTGTVVCQLKDADGNVVKDNAGGAQIDNIAPGVYTLIYSITEAGGDSYVKTYEITVNDTTKPVITAENIVTSGRTGVEIALAKFSATDNGTLKEVTVVVTKDGEEVNVFRDAFNPSTAGKYVVTCTATDAAGNVNVYEYTVSVAKTVNIGLPWWAILLIVLGGIVLAAGIAYVVLLILHLKGKNVGFMTKLMPARKAPADQTETDGTDDAVIDAPDTDAVEADGTDEQ